MMKGWPLYLYVRTSSYNTRQSALKCRSCNAWLYCDSQHVCQGFFFTMNLEQCIVKKMFKMETCGITSEEVLRLGNNKGKIPLLFKLFLEWDIATPCTATWIYLLVRMLNLVLASVKITNYSTFQLKKKMVNDYLNLELTNMVTYFKHAARLLLEK